jgi:tryptophan-rich sensory protein
MEKIKNIIYALFSIIAVFATAFIGSIFTSRNIDAWYTTINLPKFIPPNFVFPLVWDIIFILMVISFYLILKEKVNTKKILEYKRQAIFLFVLQLIFNVLWSLLFFQLHLILYALIEVIILELLIISNVLKFRKINLTSAYLLLPYAIWVLFGVVLNLYIFLLN